METDPRVQLWKRMLSPECASLRDEANAAETTSAADIARLRKGWPPELVRAALELAQARRRAARKFDKADRLVADVAGVQQATSQLIATHKSRRFAAAQFATVLDLCSGIGGDAMALAQVASVTAIDRDPLRAWMTHQNAACKAIIAPVENIELSADAFHIDPSRRDEASGQRRHNFADYSPNPDFLRHLIARVSSGAIKLGPGINIDDLPAFDPSQLEFISEHGTLTQALLWTGTLATQPSLRTATQLPFGVQLTAAPSTDIPVVVDGAPRRFLLAIDPAIERARLIPALVQQTGALALHARVGLLTHDNLVDSPWLTPFELLAHLPWREQRVRQWLHAHHAGIVEIKTRGKIVNPDSLQSRLRGTGDTPFTIFILRLDRAVHAFITKRVHSAPTHPG